MKLVFATHNKNKFAEVKALQRKLIKAEEDTASCEISAAENFIKEI